MGLFDMFGSGKKQQGDEELRENIEKIREKVQQEGRGQARQGQERTAAPTPDETEETPQPPRPPHRGKAPEVSRKGQHRPPRGQARPGQQEEEEEVQERQEQESTTPGPGPVEHHEPGRATAPSRRDREQRQQEQRAGQERKQQQDQAQQQGARERTGGRIRQPPQQSARREQAGEQEPAQTRQEQGREEEAEEHPAEHAVPSPPEVKELDIPEIDKGPLFITVDKFRESLNMVSEMRQVAQDLEASVGSLEGTLSEDRETTDDVEQALEEARQHTERMKDIVSP